MNLEAMIEQIWIYTSRPRSSELRDALRGCIRASLEMHMKDVFERVWSCTWRRSIWRRKIMRKALMEADTLFIAHIHDGGNVEC